MGYRTLNLERKPSRISDTIGVTARGVTFNRIVGRDGAFWLTGIKYNEE